MVTTDEIRRRVEAAAQERITQRADVAASLASDYASWQRVRQELAEAEAHLVQQFVNAQSLMTVAELAEFTDIAEADLLAATRSVKDPRGRRAGAKSTRTRRTRTSRPRKTSVVAVDAEAVAAPASETADVQPG